MKIDKGKMKRLIEDLPIYVLCITITCIWFCEILQTFGIRGSDVLLSIKNIDVVGMLLDIVVI